MAKLAVVLEETQTLDFNFASNPTIMNVSDSPLYVLGPDEEKTVDGLDIPTRNKVMAALYAVRPGETRVIGKGVFKIILGVFCSAFLSYGGKIQTPKEDDETETTTPPADNTPPANESNPPANDSTNQTQADDSNQSNPPANESNDQTQTTPSA